MFTSVVYKFYVSYMHLYHTGFIHLHLFTGIFLYVYQFRNLHKNGMIYIEHLKKEMFGIAIVTGVLDSLIKIKPLTCSRLLTRDISINGGK